MSTPQSTKPLSPAIATLLSSITVGMLTGLLSFCCCIFGLNGLLTVIGAKRLAHKLPTLGICLLGACLAGLISGSLASVVQITSALYSKKSLEDLPLSDNEIQLFQTMLDSTLESWVATWLQGSITGILFAGIGAFLAWLWLWNQERPEANQDSETAQDH